VRTQVRWLSLAQTVSRPYGAVAAFRAPNVQERDVFVQTQAAWDRQLEQGGRLEFTGSYQHAAFRPSSPLPFGASVDRVIDGLVPSLVQRTGLNRVDAG